MVETQTWTRRGSNPKLLEQEVIDIPLTPMGEGKYGAFPVSQTLITPLFIAAWFCTFPILVCYCSTSTFIVSLGTSIQFFTECYTCACTMYSFIAMSCLEIVPMQFIVSRKQFSKILALSFIFSFSVICGNTSLHYFASFL